MQRMSQNLSIEIFETYGALKSVRKDWGYTVITSTVKNVILTKMFKNRSQKQQKL